MKKKSLPTLGAIAIAILMGTTLSPIVNAALPHAVSGERLPSLAPMLENVAPAVVSISVKGEHVLSQPIPDAFRFFFGPNAPSEQTQEKAFRGLASGVIIDAKKGYIVTNHHVIEDAKDINVQLLDGREFEAELIGSDKMSDIALLKISKAENLTEIKFADSDKLRVGDFAIAIGNPFGLGQTVTSGIISALGRSGLNLENLENFIQTDAAINTGNSGGALVNLNGELVGINTAILGPNGGNVGIGFAIPINMTKNFLDQIIEFGEVRRGVLGVQGGELTTELAKAFGYTTNHGAFVSQVVMDSAADKAGIKAGDIIVSVDGKNIRTFGELRAKVASIGAEKSIDLGLIRDGKIKHVTAMLKNANTQKAKAETLHKSLTGAELESYSQNDLKGVRVADVKKDSIAARYGLQKNDIIVGMNRIGVNNLADLRKLFETKPNVLALNIVRDNSNLYLILR